MTTPDGQLVLDADGHYVENCETMAWSLDALLDRLPSETFTAQCWIGGEGEERLVPAVQERFGNAKVMWASDYPHFEAQTAGNNVPIVLDRDDLTTGQRAGFLAEAALEFYRLDEDRIAAA